jgi:Ca-activated chloride channel family protein
MKNYLLIFITVAGVVASAANSTRNLTGTVCEFGNKTPLSGVKISVMSTAAISYTNAGGHFNIAKINPKTHLIFSLAGYKSDTLMAGNAISLNVFLKKSVVFKVDSVEYRPSAYKVKENMSVDEILKKMPGVQVNRYGYIGAQGQGVVKVRVNDKDFSGGSVQQALKNLPADIVEKIQIIDDYGEQAAMTGIKSGQPDKILNFPVLPSDESYSRIVENKFINPATAPLSTFAVDVDAASYANVRRFINAGQLPPKNAVRIEEMINYFKYNLPEPTSGEPVAIQTEVAAAPWNPQHQLVRIGLKAKNVKLDKLPPSNLVFLVDVSGSMNEPNKLPLVKTSMKMLVDQLRPIDNIAIVVYAGSVVLGWSLLRPAISKK